MSDFKMELKKKEDDVNRLLKDFLPRAVGAQKTVIQAMNYSVNVGGKRLRPIILGEVCALFGGRLELARPFMAAIEMIHTYSLVHDDLPAMDNDLLRRGKPTTHAKFGEAIAILAGDGLLNYAFETALSAFDAAKDETDRIRVARALGVLSKKAGIYGMIGGQTADIESEEAQEISEKALLFIHEHKTAALIEAAFQVGAILGGASDEDVKKLGKCGSNIGLAFQIQDDLLDVFGTTEELGKPVGSDEKNKKQTYVTLHGQRDSEGQVKRLSEAAIRLLREMPADASFLEELVRSLIDRRK